MDKVAGGAVGVLAGVYLIAVARAGHSKDLFALLKEETGYLELLAAMYALWLLHEKTERGGIVDQLIMVALIAAAVKLASNTGNIVPELEKFGNGEQGLFTTFGHVFSSIGVK
jgi:hypothetical protein